MQLYRGNTLGVCSYSLWTTISIFSVIRGVGELDFQDSMKKEKATEILSNRKAVDTNCPYLLLDVRSEEEFKQCHIISGAELKY